ncbi:uncharacterized [Tachysurus ichikawai]
MTLGEKQCQCLGRKGTRWECGPPASATVMLLMLVYKEGGGGGGSNCGGVGEENNSPKVEHGGKQEGCGQDPSAAAATSARLFPQSLMCGHTALCTMR